jgi:hypothetical protein
MISAFHLPDDTVGASDEETVTGFLDPLTSPNIDWFVDESGMMSGMPREPASRRA